MAQRRVKTRSLKTQAANYPVPQSKQEVTAAIRHLGNLQGERLRRKAELDDELTRLKGQYEEILKPIGERMAQLLAGIQTYCEARRDELTRGGKTKTADFGTGEASWRSRPPSVRIRGMAAVMSAVKDLGLAGEFLRVREEIDKEAMLRNPQKASGIAGVTIGSAGEDFVVKPAEHQLEEVCKK